MDHPAIEGAAGGGRSAARQGYDLTAGDGVVEHVREAATRDSVRFCEECDRLFDARSGCETDIRADERARIRRELMAWADPRLAGLRGRQQGRLVVDALDVHDCTAIGILSDLRSTLDRICPEEGRSPRSDRLARLDALLASEEPPEGLWRRLQETFVAGLVSDSTQRGTLAAAAWRWFREQIGVPPHTG